MGGNTKGGESAIQAHLPPHPTLSHQGRGLFGVDSSIKKNISTFQLYYFLKNRFKSKSETMDSPSRSKMTIKFITSRKIIDLPTI